MYSTWSLLSSPKVSEFVTTYELAKDFNRREVPWTRLVRIEEYQNEPGDLKVSSVISSWFTLASRDISDGVQV